jgi:hypothetical protein
MRHLILLFLCNLFICIGLAQVHVNGYYRSNGTYVLPYTRSSPDGNPYNNYSYPGNVNPYTGKVAPGNPDTYLDRYYHRSTYPTTPSSTTYSSPYSSQPRYFANNDNDDYIRRFGFHVKTQKLNVRLCPYSSSTIVAILDFQTQVEVLDRSQAPWYYINVYSNNPITDVPQVATGYVRSEYLSHDEPATAYNEPATTYSEPRTTYNEPSPSFQLTPNSAATQEDPIGYYFVATPTLKVYSSPSVRSELITQLAFKTEVTVVSYTDYPWNRAQVSYINSAGRAQNMVLGYVYGPDLTTSVPVSARSSALQDARNPPSSAENNTTAHPYGLDQGRINFWSNVPNEDISLYVDYVHQGQLTTCFSAQPGGCGGLGTISFLGTRGKHLLQAIGRTYHWAGYINIRADECDMLKISKDQQ